MPLPRIRNGAAIGLVLLVAGLAAGGICRIGSESVSDGIWIGTTALGGLPTLARIVRMLLRRQLGVDLVALLAMAGCLVLGEYLAGAVIAVMFASGRALEAYAERRAQSALSALVARAPTIAHLQTNEGITDVDVDDIRPGDRLLVKKGDVIPVDGVAESAAVLDEAALTGEAFPVLRQVGDGVKSGVVNSGSPFTLRATSTAAAGTYAGIVRMVAAAREGRAPLVRLADRYAVGFLFVTLALAVFAWIVSGDPVRALAVLVVATPCPLIIAAPVAIVAGISRAARAGVIVKGGAVLERLATLRVLLFDKTGTLTAGTPSVHEISVVSGYRDEDVSRYAASLDQMSSHPLAAALRRYVEHRHLPLDVPSDVHEEPGAGVAGRVDGHDVRVGRADFVGTNSGDTRWERRLTYSAQLESLTPVFVGIDGVIAGAFLVADEIRPDSSRTLRALRRAGLTRLIMVTGDRREIGDVIGAAVGVDAVIADQTPADKADVVRREAVHGPVGFVGDGINDSPALASADVGIAIGSRGASVASEAADAILVSDRLDGIGEAIKVARRARAIALQSIVVGMGLSAVAMILAAFGWLIPVFGALSQEGIDVIVILNALRALTGGSSRAVPQQMASLSTELFLEHRALAVGISALREFADRLDGLPVGETMRSLEQTVAFLQTRVLPHERAEADRFYPMVERHVGGSDPTATMVRSHAEISRQVTALARILRWCEREGLESSDRLEIKHALYALHATLLLHNAQEEEAYLSLAPEPDGAVVPAAGSRS